MSRISDAMDEVQAVQNMLDVTPKGKDYQADWDADRKAAQAHLSDAWLSLGYALSSTGLGNRYPTRNDEHRELIEAQREAAALRSEMERLEGALAGARAAAVQASLRSQQVDDRANRLRKLIMNALHLDQADAAEGGEWRMKLCETLLPEIERVMSGP